MTELWQYIFFGIGIAACTMGAGAILGKILTKIDCWYNCNKAKKQLWKEFDKYANYSGKKSLEDRVTFIEKMLEAMIEGK